MAITEQQRAAFLSRIAAGRSVRDVCSDEDMPTRSAIYELLAADKDFADHYARVCDLRADEVFDEIFEIADDEGDKSGEAIRRAQLRIDARKWALARMAPRKYGDKLNLDHSGGFTVTLPKDVGKL